MLGDHVTFSTIHCIIGYLLIKLFFYHRPQSMVIFTARYRQSDKERTIHNRLDYVECWDYNSRLHIVHRVRPDVTDTARTGRSDEGLLREMCCAQS